MNNPCFLQIALATPLRKLFTYLPPLHCNPENIFVGSRIRVPFGRREEIGILVTKSCHSTVEPAKMKHALEYLNLQAVITITL